MALATAFLILLVAAPAAVYGASHTVGDSNGWNSGVNYTDWTSGKTFTVGDTLVFNYDSSHKVDGVSQADYSSCSSSNPTESHDSSPTTITLKQAGPHYYICPTPGHCSSGQKLLVNVVAAATPPPTTSPATPPPTTSPATPPPTTSPATPPPTTSPATPTTPPTTTPASPPPPATATPANNSSPPPPPPPPKSAASSLNMNLVGVPLVLATLMAVMR